MRLVRIVKLVLLGAAVVGMVRTAEGSDLKMAAVQAMPGSAAEVATPGTPTRHYQAPAPAPVYHPAPAPQPAAATQQPGPAEKQRAPAHDGGCPTECCQSAKKICVSQTEKATRTTVKYRCECKTICLPNCNSLLCGCAHSCEGACGGECGRPREVRRLYKRFVKEERCETACKLLDAPVCGAAPNCPAQGGSPPGAPVTPARPAGTMSGAITGAPAAYSTGTLPPAR